LSLDWTIVVGQRRFEPAEFLAFASHGASIALLDYVLRSYSASVYLRRGAHLAQFVMSIGLVCARTGSGVGALIVSRSYGGPCPPAVAATVALPLLFGAASWKAYVAGLLCSMRPQPITIVAMITLLAGTDRLADSGSIERPRTARRPGRAASPGGRAPRGAAPRVVGSWWWNLAPTECPGPRSCIAHGLRPRSQPPHFDDHSRCFLHADQLLALSAAVDHARRTGTAFALELELVRADGESVW